jgi:hypothetical protein
MSLLNPANVMVALRDHIANDVESLCREFHVASSGFGSPSPAAGYGQSSPAYGRYEVENVLRQLLDAGLIVHEGVGGSFSGRIEVVPNWRKVQAVLGLSLKKLGETGPDSLTVRPFFGKPAGFSTPLDVFVMMSFKPELRPVYDDHILNVANSLNLVTRRADDFFGAHHIMSDIWEAINAARLVIADCTGRNPNVFYEIGMAHTLGRTVILITQNSDDVPFDLQTIRYLQYEYTPRGMAAFEKNLERTLKAELEASIEPRLPTPYSTQMIRTTP